MDQLQLLQLKDLKKKEINELKAKHKLVKSINGNKPFIVAQVI